jgi:NAD(P)-dependent dehydrogenase (short-subunit alcohol dehydrogenase family)
VAAILDFKDRGIRVDTISLGVIQTPGVGELFGGVARARDTKDEMAGLIPLGRIGQPEAIAGSVLFLAFDEASFVNGVELFVDGGMVQVRAKKGGRAALHTGAPLGPDFIEEKCHSPKQLICGAHRPLVRR